MSPQKPTTIIPVNENRRRAAQAGGKVIEFPGTAAIWRQGGAQRGKVVTQARLREAQALLEKENEVVRLRRELLLGILNDLQDGAEVEPGDLRFAPELGTVLLNRRTS